MPGDGGSVRAAESRTLPDRETGSVRSAKRRTSLFRSAETGSRSPGDAAPPNETSADFGGRAIRPLVPGGLRKSHAETSAVNALPPAGDNLANGAIASKPHPETDCAVKSRCL